MVSFRVWCNIRKDIVTALAIADDDDDDGWWRWQRRPIPIAPQLFLTNRTNNTSQLAFSTFTHNIFCTHTTQHQRTQRIHNVQYNRRAFSVIFLSFSLSMSLYICLSLSIYISGCTAIVSYCFEQEIVYERSCVSARTIQVYLAVLIKLF